MSEMTTYHWSFQEDIEAYRTAGIDAVGVWRQKLTEFGEERGAELLRESGLTVSSLSFAGGFTGSDGDSCLEAIDDALEAIDLAAEIQASCLVLVSGSRVGHTGNHARRLLRDALLRLGDAAGERNLQLALQPMQESPTVRLELLSMLDGMLDVLHRCDHPHVGLACDVYHLGKEAEFANRLPQVMPWIKTVTLSDRHDKPRSDNDRCLPGDGVLGIAELVCGLHAAEYQGYYDIQIHSDKYWNSDYVQLLKSCQESFQRLCPVIQATE